MLTVELHTVVVSIKKLRVLQKVGKTFILRSLTPLVFLIHVFTHRGPLILDVVSVMSGYTATFLMREK